MNLEVKLGVSEQKKLVDMFKQSEDVEGAEQYQTVLDEEAEFIDGVLTRISELKILKGKVEQKYTKLVPTERTHTEKQHTKQTMCLLC